MTWRKRIFGDAEQPVAAEPKLPELSDNEDHLYRDAAMFVLSSGRCSISAIQRHLKIGYNRATDLVDALENDFVVSPMGDHGERHLLTEPEKQQARLRPSKAEIFRQQQDKETALRLSYLLEKYNDDHIVKQIISGNLWEGMTAAHLFDAFGEPEAVDQKYLMQVSREVWKYESLGGNRYRIRVTLENGIVVGWDIKSLV
ncbi:DNA translocase FtsK [Pseudomonas sp. NA-150]|uniref:DNA translocase FtsK n=1 Tax=Pseudomonas sp. NA-150 TaxID=3367525 RepID=UPI0037C5F80E